MAADPSTAGPSAAGAIARLHDPDRFLTALFAPAARRERLFVLIAFNHELVRALELTASRAAAGPMAALIRLQWWRDVIEGQSGGHELAAPLQRLVTAGSLPRGTLLALVEAREAEAQGLETMQAWRDATLAGAGGMQVAFAQALGEADPEVLERLREVGAAYGAGATLRHLPALLQAGRQPLPMDATGETTAWLREAGREWLREAGRVLLPRERRAAELIRVLAARDLSRGVVSGRRGLGDRLAVAAAFLRPAP